VRTNDATAAARTASPQFNIKDQYKSVEGAALKRATAGMSQEDVVKLLNVGGGEGGAKKIKNSIGKEMTSE
jgi:hypothetical protein